MGIRHLTRLLLPFSENVLMEGRRPQKARTQNIESVVIDGPSLVYHVYQRLLSGSNTRLNSLDAQPTCNEVSLGVMMYLLQLMLLGIKVTKICFDGALPATKRETRLSRLEKSRRKLELFCSQTRLGVGKSDILKDGYPISPGRVLQSRTTPVKHSNLPENPFMVPSVFEDLKRRWNKNNILTAAEGAILLNSLEIDDDFPWAAATVMIPGEADIECAHTSKLTGSAVLTNDSDLLLHDLGSHGSVLFLDSVELSEWNPLRPTESKIKARMLCPGSLACRLGIKNIHHFAYELNKNPQLGLSELIRRSKNSQDSHELIPNYRQFVKEYDYVPNGQPVMMQLPQHLDPRISELFCQLRSTYVPGNVPHIYLAILNEDHSRLCAWEEGRLYRTLGFSILNLSCSATERCEFVDEHARRGGRIAINRISLGNEEWIAAEMGFLCERLNSARAVFDGDTSSPCFWMLFALCDVCGLGTRDAALPEVEQLCRFFTLGYMGEKLEWADIHLLARIHAVLYSMRILSQLLEPMSLTEGPMLKTRSILAALPPLHIMMRSRREMNLEVSGDMPINKASRDFLCLFGQTCCDTHNQPVKAAQPQHTGRGNLAILDQGDSGDTRYTSNPYELLSLE